MYLELKKGETTSVGEDGETLKRVSVVGRNAKWDSRLRKQVRQKVTI